MAWDVWEVILGPRTLEASLQCFILHLQRSRARVLLPHTKMSGAADRRGPERGPERGRDRGRHRGRDRWWDRERDRGQDRGQDRGPERRKRGWNRRPGRGDRRGGGRGSLSRIGKHPYLRIQSQYHHQNLNIHVGFGKYLSRESPILILIKEYSGTIVSTGKDPSVARRIFVIACCNGTFGRIVDLSLFHLKRNICISVVTQRAARGA
jgi:hypothetical protein